MKTINELQDEIIEEFEGLDDWMDRYQMLIDLGNDLEPLPDVYKTEENLIDGCQSRVWVQCDLIKPTPDPSLKEGEDDSEDQPFVMHMQADSDALIVKGIVALLLRVLSDHTPQEILDADLYFIDRIGLREHLSPTRSNGLLAMVKQIRSNAMQASQMNNEK